MPNSNDEIDRFWAWYSSIADQILAAMPSSLIWTLLSHNIEQLGLTDWDFGPLDTSTYYLAISPGGNREKIELANNIISRAPVLPGWKFFPFKPRKKWDQKFQLSPNGPLLNASDWKFKIYQYNDGMVELAYVGQINNKIGKNKMIDAIIIGVENEIGEELFMRKICDISLDSNVNDTEQAELFKLGDLFSYLESA
eukprot:gene15417-18117_t